MGAAAAGSGSQAGDDAVGVCGEGDGVSGGEGGGEGGGARDGC